MSTSNRKRQFEPQAGRIGSRAITLLSMFTVAAWAMTATAASPDQSFSDEAIASAVRSDLRLDPAVSSGAVEVQGAQGIVTLTGTVNDLPAKRRAVRIAQSIRGVLGVIDRVTVTPVSRPDEDIRRDILSALLNDPATESYQVAASVQDAVVALTGTVGSWAESQLAQRIAEGVKGVKDVHNDITINYTEKRTDDEIAADIRSALQWDVWMEGEPVDVAVKEGQVSLSGPVGSAVAKSRAVWDAWVNGVKAVDDSGLKVDPLLGDQLRRRQETAKPSDSEIKKAVELSFGKDPRLTHNTISVSVEEGVVILSGAVSHLKAKSAAEQDARDIVGVEVVDNQLIVQPLINWPGDAEVQKGLDAALAWDPRLAGTQIEAAVVDHIAYLGGVVDSSEEKAEAQDVASRTKGVTFIRNRLRIEPQTGVFFYDQPYYDYETFVPLLKSDAQIKKDVERAFFWSPFVHRDDITVTVDDGVVKLKGIVGSWIGYEEAYEDAHKSGADAVIMRLKVR